MLGQARPGGALVCRSTCAGCAEDQREQVTLFVGQRWECVHHLP